MRLKRLIAVILALIVVLCAVPTTFAADMPEFIRIGLYFNYGNIKSAVESFTISAQSGVEIGWYSGADFYNIYSNSDNSILKVKRDSEYYYAFYNGISTKEQAQAKADEIKAKGVKAFAAIDNLTRWAVLIGGYADKATADADKASNLDKVLQGYELAQVEPSAKRIVIENASGQDVCGFYSDAFRLNIRAGAANTIKVLKVNTKTYRGEIEVIRQQASDMTVVNILAFEQYLYGVVPAEIGASSPMEALKAQAVAARTYASRSMNKYASLGFNLCNTVNSQVYLGFSAESSASNKAVDGTAGQILTFNGKPAEVFYFSSSGGMTEDVKNVWGSTGYPYLVSVEDKYETPTTTNYTWSLSFTADQIKSKVSKDIGNVIGMEVTKRSPAGRATELIIKGTKDQAVYTLEKTRTFLSLPSQYYTIQSDTQVSVGTKGDSIIKQPSSLKIITAWGVKDASTQGNLNVIGADGIAKEISSTPTKYTLTGKGWGHAIGMSQNGAMGMARAGFTYKQIMEHYFTGAVVQ